MEKHFEYVGFVEIVRILSRNIVIFIILRHIFMLIMNRKYASFQTTIGSYLFHDCETGNNVATFDRLNVRLVVRSICWTVINFLYRASKTSNLISTSWNSKNNKGE